MSILSANVANTKKEQSKKAFEKENEEIDTVKE